VANKPTHTIAEFANSNGNLRLTNAIASTDNRLVHSYIIYYLNLETMKTFRTIALFLLFALSAVSAFTTVSSTAGSSFVISQRPQAETAACPARNGVSSLYMGKQAKFGIFSPAVYGAKFALGTKGLNKIRGKGIGLHSQTIGDFCEWAGAYHLRTKLIKLAKTNGDILGFLV
jgi:hypothetical protein